MKANFVYLLCCLTGLPVVAQVTLPTIRVSSEVAPPGGMAQMKVQLTSPKPITSGTMELDMSDVSFDSIDGIALFSGDITGAAVVNGKTVNVQFTSPKGTFGTTDDYPLLIVALTLSQNCISGQTFRVNLNPSASVWQDLLGAPIAFEFQQDEITVGGSLSITNVTPGGGILPAGGTFSILGTGFTPQTKVSVRGVSTSSVQYISPTDIRVTVKEGGMLDGAFIQVENPDKSSDSYYSYMRGVPVGQSKVSLLTKTVPVFSTSAAFEVILPPTISAQLNRAYFTAVALQNSNPMPATITIESHSASGALIGSTQITLAPGTRILREVSGLLGAPAPVGGYLHVDSPKAFQMVGLLGNSESNVVTPVSLNVLSAPVTPAASDTAPSGANSGGSDGFKKGGGGDGNGGEG